MSDEEFIREIFAAHLRLYRRHLFETSLAAAEESRADLQRLKYIILVLCLSRHSAVVLPIYREVWKNETAAPFLDGCLQAVHRQAYFEIPKLTTETYRD